jgi:hypothetical protein
MNPLNYGRHSTPSACGPFGPNITMGLEHANGTHYDEAVQPVPPSRKQNLDRRFALAAVLIGGLAVLAGGCNATTFGSRYVSSTTSSSGETTVKVGKGPEVVGTGAAVTVDKKFTEPFTRVEAEFAFTVDITKGKTQSVTVVAQKEIANLITPVLSRNGAVRFDIPQDFKTTLPVRISIVVPTLEGVAASGSSRASVSGFEDQKFDANASGGGSLTIDGKKLAIQADASGASQVVVNAADVVSLSGTASGASKISVARVVRQVNLTLSGASKFEAARVEADSVELNLSGASGATLKDGVSKATKVNVSGTSSISAPKFAAGNLTGELSGGANATFLSGVNEIKSSGTAKIEIGTNEKAPN